MQISQDKKRSLSYFLNKIPKTIVKQKGYAVVANDLQSAKAFAKRKGLTGTVLLTETSDSKATIYYSSKELIDIAVDLHKKHELSAVAKKESGIVAVIKRLFKTSKTA